MKICFLAGTLGRGGAERQLVFMLRAARRAGFSVRLICLTQGEAFEAEIRSEGFRVDFVGASPIKLKRLYEIVKNLRHDRADILQSAHFYTNIYAGIVGRILKIPSVGAIRSDLQSELKAHGWLGEWQLKLPRHLIVNSEKAFRRAKKCGIEPDKISFVKNAVETVAIEPKIESNELQILFVGRLVPLKRPELFVRLAERLEEKLPDYKLNFTLVGDGEMLRELKVSAEKLNLKRHRISFAGRCDEVGEFYRRGDVLVLTSLYEGTPNAILEAMAYGLPVVAANVGGVAEIVDATRGVLVDCENEENLVEAVENLITNSDLRRRLGGRGREYVETHYSPENLEKHLAAIYRGLTAK